MASIITKDIVNRRLLELGKNITLIGDYSKQKTKTLFKCHLGHEWHATPDNVMRRSGCPTCEKYNHLARAKSQLSSKEEINEYLISNNRKYY